MQAVLLWMILITLLMFLVHMWKENGFSAEETIRESLRSPIERTTERKKIINKKISWNCYYFKNKSVVQDVCSLKL